MPFPSPSAVCLWIRASYTSLEKTGYIEIVKTLELEIFYHTAMNSAAKPLLAFRRPLSCSSV